MGFAVESTKLLEKEFGLKARVVSFPCQRLFEQQPIEYKREVLKCRSKAPRMIIEAYAVNGWERYADAGVSMSTFGHFLQERMLIHISGLKQKPLHQRSLSLLII